MSDNAGIEGRRTLGGTLAAERERQALSRADVAQRLHMSPSQIEAIERDDYGRLPRGTFLRGFVRNYAKVLGLEPDDVLSLLAEGVPREAAPRIIVPTQNIRFDPLGERLSSPYVKAGTLAVVAVAIGFAAMYWAMYVRPTTLRHGGEAAPTSALRAELSTGAAPAPAIVASSPPLEPAASSPPATGAMPSAPAFTPAKAADAVAKPAAAPAKPAVDPGAAPVPAKVAAGGKPTGPAKLIRFHFQGDSWVEVRDARGKVIFQRLNTAGSDAEVSGRPPMDVVVGNAPEVRVKYDGQDFPLEPHTNVAVARFTLE